MKCVGAPVVVHAVDLRRGRVAVAGLRPVVREVRVLEPVAEEEGTAAVAERRPAVTQGTKVSALSLSVTWPSLASPPPPLSTEESVPVSVGEPPSEASFADESLTDVSAPESGPPPPGLPFDWALLHAATEAKNSPEAKIVKTLRMMQIVLQVRQPCLASEVPSSHARLPAC